MEDKDINKVASPVVESPDRVPQQFFFDKKEQERKHVESDDGQDEAGKLVKNVLHAGILHKVQTDDQVREKVLGTADKVIRTRLDVEKNIADKADKTAFFEANEAACTYFGYDERTTAKSHVKMMRVWSWFFNALYIISIGFFVVAPIVFFASKLRVAVKNNWIVIVLAVGIYLAVILTPFLLTWLGRL